MDILLVLHLGKQVLGMISTAPRKAPPAGLNPGHPKPIGLTFPFPLSHSLVLSPIPWDHFPEEMTCLQVSFSGSTFRGNRRAGNRQVHDHGQIPAL